MKNNELMIRDYLLRTISDKVVLFEGKLSRFRKKGEITYSGFFKELVRFFSNDFDGDEIRKIFYLRNRDTHKNFAIYNYFDIDTLISYNKFLETVLDEIDNNMLEDKRYILEMSDIKSGYESAKKIWKSCEGKPCEKNGFYNKQCPVKCFVGKDGVISPRKAYSSAYFNKKYDRHECIKEINSYIMDKHCDKLVNPLGDLEDVYKSSDIYTFNYKGKTIKLLISSRESYFDINGMPVVQIVADGKEGKLFVTNYLNGEIYNGELFDSEGQPLGENGGFVFYENRLPKKGGCISDDVEELDK